MKKINNIDQALEDVKRRKAEAEKTKQDAEQAIKDADDEIQKVSDTEGKLVVAKQKQEEADRAYDDAFSTGGYEKNDTKKQNGFVKGLIIGATTVALIAGGCKLIKEAKAGNIKLFNSEPTNSTQQSVKPETTEATIVEEPMDAEKLEEISTNFIKYLQDRQINVNSEDVIKLVTVINIDRMSEECPELVKEIIGTQTKEEFLGDAFKVIGTIMDYNRVVYEKEETTDNIIRLSDIVYGEVNAEHLKFIEGYVDRISTAKNDPAEQERLVSEFIVALYSSTGPLENIEDGIGLASVVAVDAMANHVTFVNGTCQISEELRGKLINYTTAELYISNIFANMDKCLADDQMLYYIPTDESKSYTRGLRF